MTHDRRSFLAGTALAGATAVFARAAGSSANSEVNLAVIGLGGRGNFLLREFSKIPGVNIVAICDPDKTRLEAAGKKFASQHPDAKPPKAQLDLRNVLDDPKIDAVAIATCNHWHCLATIWACQAGKHVYVEKPLGHNMWEQQQAVSAARIHRRIVQVGTQQRSDPMQAEIKRFLHRDAVLGKPTHVIATRFGTRESIGKRASPLIPPATVDYNLWLGPAAEEPIYRDQFHYDWHWNWNTGNGEMGNWGVHVLDDIRNVVLQDRVDLPTTVCSIGGRVAWKDAGETPNVHFTLFETDEIPVIFALSNLDPAPNIDTSVNYQGPPSGYVAYCEGGWLCGERGQATAYDSNGTVVKKFKGNMGGGHYANFIDAVRQGQSSLLNADVTVGHMSSAWCHVANAICASGEPVTEIVAADSEMLDAPQPTLHPWVSLRGILFDHLRKHHDNPFDGTIFSSPTVRLDESSHRFVGAVSDEANRWMRRDYRTGFEVVEQLG